MTIPAAAVISALAYLAIFRRRLDSRKLLGSEREPVAPPVSSAHLVETFSVARLANSKEVLNKTRDMQTGWKGVKTNSNRYFPIRFHAYFRTCHVFSIRDRFTLD